MEQLNVFGGKGFVGSRFVDLTPDCIINERNDYQVKSKNILYFISTIDNYNVFTDPYVDIDTNLTTLVRVLSSIKEEDRPFTTFNFISSWFVYGDTDWPARETSPCNPKGFYSITKRAAEQLLISYCQTFGIQYRILRLANVAGSTDPKASKKKNAIVHMIKELKGNRPIKLYDHGNVYRDIIDLDDCVSAINLVLQRGNLNDVYNVGNGKPVLLGEFMNRAKKLLDSTSEIGYMDTPDFHKFVQVKSMYMNNDKLKELGYTPRYSLEEIIWRIANGS
jgi:nucleoside-diphosphate-sugar epimerase